MILNVANTIGGPCTVEVARNGATYSWVYVGFSNDSRECALSCEPGDTLRVAWGSYPTQVYPGGQVLTVSNTWTDVLISRGTQVGPSGAMTVRLVGETQRASLAVVQASASAKIAVAFLGLLVGLAIWASWQRARR